MLLLLTVYCFDLVRCMVASEGTVDTSKPHGSGILCSHLEVCQKSHHSSVLVTTVRCKAHAVILNDTPDGHSK